MILPRDNFAAALSILRKSASADALSVLVLCACDADSLCCLHIITTLLQKERVTYRQRPVAVQEDLERADEEFSAPGAQFTSVFLINCGGTVPLADVLPSAPESAVLYVIDSHRPYHPANVADSQKVVLLGDEFSDDAAAAQPATQPRSAAAADGDDDDDGREGSGSDDEEVGPRAAKRARVAEPQERDGSFYGPSASQVAYWLAEHAGRDSDADVMWWAVVGATDQLVHRRVQRAAYDAFARTMRLQLGAQSAAGEAHAALSAADIVGVRELQLVLLRHWSLYESLLHSPVFATKLGLWRQNGRQKLELLLARVGVPLAQSKAPFASLPTDVRTRVAERLPDCISAAAVPDKSALYSDAFVREYRGARHVRLSAADVVYATEAVLESGTDDAFWRAYSCVAPGSAHVEDLLGGVQLAIEQQRDVVEQAAGMLAGRAVVMAGPFRYALLHESTLLPRFVHPIALARLAHFLMDALNEIRPNKKPLLLAALNEDTNSYLTVAQAQGCLSSANKNEFGLLFHLAAERTGTKITHHGFDNAVVQVHRDDMTKFMDYLNTAMLPEDRGDDDAGVEAASRSSSSRDTRERERAASAGGD